MYERFPPGDEPDVVDLFQASLADLPPTTKPSRLLDRPPTGFGLGGDKTSLRLLAGDVALIHAVAAANPRTVVALQTGSAVVVSDWIDEVPAAVYAWYGGCEAGPGLADVLLGTVNPSARLPFSVPVDEADLPEFDRDATTFVYDRWHGWWHLARNGAAPQFPFGFGLSYTDFEVGDVSVSATADGIEVRATVTNTGERDGADVVQVYAELPDPDAPPRLVGFARVEVPAGGSADVAITVPAARFETRDGEAHRWRPPSGTHRITVGRHAGDPAAVTVPVDL
jgi:beta-glucosidase